MLFVLLIATANVTNLFVLRGERLRHEIAVSAALGGGAAALARRFIVEGAVLGLASAVVSLPIVAAALTSRFGFSTRDLPRLHEITFGAWPIVVTLMLGLFIGASVGLVAFARSHRAGLQDGLRASTRTTSPGGLWRRVQQTLVATQVAVALALVSSAALLGRSLWNLSRVELGFVREQRSSFEVTLPYVGYENYTKAALFHAAVLDRLRAIPLVEGAESAMEIPLIAENPGELTFDYDAVGLNKEERGGVNMASDGYFQLMGIPLLHGRSFMAGDVRAENPAIVLSASLARGLFGKVDVVGSLVRPPSPGADVFYRVVGVVGDVPRWRIEDGPARMAYFPLLRDGDGLPLDSMRIPILMSSARYVVRSDASVEQLASSMRDAVRGVDPRVPVTNFTSLNGMVETATARVRLTMLLLGASATAALLLGVIGIYSVVSYAVAGRRRELGVRIALGATPSRIRRMIVLEGGAIVGIGIAAGLVVALYGARLAQSMLYGVSTTDPLLFGGAALLLAAVALAATSLPASRAARLDPSEIMRSEI
jgi:putative ABC transport system permease protein